MADILEFLLWPLLALAVLAGMHCYLGLHVVRRGIIFVDLALAQMAALGWVCAVGWGYDPHEDAGSIYWISLLFALAGAALFAFVRSRRHAIPQEAIIGITYAVASAVAIIIITRVPHDMKVGEMLTRDILLVESGDVIKAAVLYAVIGLAHFFMRKPVYQISIDADQARADGTRVWAWDLFFYGTFAVVVTLSVRLAGVLLVFALLVIPAVTAMLFAQSMRARLVIGWGIGLTASAIGLLTAWFQDLPMSVSVVAALGGVLVICAVGSTALTVLGSRSSTPEE